MVQYFVFVWATVYEFQVTYSSGVMARKVGGKCLDAVMPRGTAIDTTVAKPSNILPKIISQFILGESVYYVGLFHKSIYLKKHVWTPEYYTMKLQDSTFILSNTIL